MGHPRPRTPAMACPHCGTKATARSSRSITPLYREVYYRCDNDLCGHTFIASLGILHSVRASATPNPQVELPLRIAPWIGKAFPVPGPTPPDVVALLDQLDTIDLAGEAHAA